MELAEIKYKLEILGYSFVSLDRKYGFTRGTCRLSVSYPHSKGEQAIAATLGIHPKDIWPNRYDE